MNLFNEDHLYNDDYLRSLEDNFVALERDRNNDDDREVLGHFSTVINGTGVAFHEVHNPDRSDTGTMSDKTRTDP